MALKGMRTHLIRGNLEHEGIFYPINKWNLLRHLITHNLHYNSDMASLEYRNELNYNSSLEKFPLKRNGGGRVNVPFKNIVT